MEKKERMAWDKLFVGALSYHYGRISSTKVEIISFHSDWIPLDSSSNLELKTFKQIIYISLGYLMVHCVSPS